MNVGYILKEDGVKVYKDKGTAIIDYTDNFEEILLKENKIETMKLELEKANNELKTKFAIRKHHLIEVMTFSPVLLLFLTVFIVPILLGNNLTETALGTMTAKEFFLKFPLPYFSAIASIILGHEVFLSKQHKNDVKGYKSEISYLENELAKETEELNKLTIIKEKRDFNNINISNINLDEAHSLDDQNSKMLNELRYHLIIIYYVNSRIDKLVKLQRKGKLAEELKIWWFNEEQTKYVAEAIAKRELVKKLK